MYEKSENSFHAWHGWQPETFTTFDAEELGNAHIWFSVSELCLTLLEGIMGFFRPAGDGKSVKQRPWYESLCFRLLRIRNCVSLTAQMDLQMKTLLLTSVVDLWHLFAGFNNSVATPARFQEKDLVHGIYALVYTQLVCLSTSQN